MGIAFSLVTAQTNSGTNFNTGNLDPGAPSNGAQAQGAQSQRSQVSTTQGIQMDLWNLLKSSTNQEVNAPSTNNLIALIQKFSEGLSREARDAIQMVLNFMKDLKFDKLNETYTGLKQEAVRSENSVLQRILKFVEIALKTIRNLLSVFTMGASDRFIDPILKIFFPH